MSVERQYVYTHTYDAIHTYIHTYTKMLESLELESGETDLELPPRELREDEGRSVYGGRVILKPL